MKRTNLVNHGWADDQGCGILKLQEVIQTVLTYCSYDWWGTLGPKTRITAHEQISKQK